jgi:hypothetical protein
MSAPVGSLSDLQDLLENGHNNVFGSHQFAFYGVLMYTPTNGLNKLLHEYVVSHHALFNTQTGPNWLVAVVEYINREQAIGNFKPEDVYKIARYLGVGVDEIPGIVFFTEPKERKETLVLRLSDVLPPPNQVTDDDLTKLFGRLAAIIDEVCNRHVESEERIEVLHQALKKEWQKGSKWGEKFTNAMGWLKVSAADAATILGAIANIVKLVKGAGLY